MVFVKIAYDLEEVILEEGGIKSFTSKIWHFLTFPEDFIGKM